MLHRRYCILFTSTPRPPKTLHNHFFNFSWVLTVVPREIDDNCYEFSLFEGRGGGKGGEDEQGVLWPM